MITIKTVPISLNSMYSGKRFLTQEGRDTKFWFSTEIRKCWKGGILDVPVSVTVRFFFPDNRRRDTSNFTKALYDSATGIIWEDDSLIHEEHIYKGIDKVNPRIELTVNKL